MNVPARIRRKIMHRVTRQLRKDAAPNAGGKSSQTVAWFDGGIQALVSKSIAEVLDEELPS